MHWFLWNHLFNFLYLKGEQVSYIYILYCLLTVHHKPLLGKNVKVIRCDILIQEGSSWIEQTPLQETLLRNVNSGPETSIRCHHKLPLILREIFFTSISYFYFYLAQITISLCEHSKQKDFFKIYMCRHHSYQ